MLSLTLSWLRLLYASGLCCKGSKHFIARLKEYWSLLSRGKHANILLVVELSLLATMLVLAASATAAATCSATSLYQ